MITDEMVEKATRAVMGCFFGGSSSLDDLAEGIAKDHARAALEAVAPMLIGPYKEVCDKFWSAYDILNDIPDDSDKAMAGGLVDEALLLYAEIRRGARAQELDPK